MKFITSIAGTVALSVRADEVMPQTGLVHRELMAFIKSTYQFSVAPVTPPNVPDFAVPSYVFQSGVFTDKERQVPLLQLAFIQNGGIISAQNTDIADRAMDDFISKLDSIFGYRFASTSSHRVYQSNIVVQFDEGLAHLIDGIAKIESVLAQEISRPTPFKIKRLAFGAGETMPIQMATSVEAIENSDFTIERRANEPYEANRYFCSAPVRTSEHIRILETIERAFQK